MFVSKLGSGEKMENWSRKIHDIMDEMRNRIFCDYRASGAWQPTVNLYETRSTYHLCVELAGLQRDAVVVECLDEKRVCITGQRAQPRTANMETPFSVELMEIDEGPFRREIELHEPVQVNTFELSYDRGYLWITLRKNVTT